MQLKLPLRRYGAKWYVADWICEHIPEHITYLEPFCGSASVLFRKPRSQAEIINDVDDKIINAFNQIKQNPKVLAALLWATPYSKENWRRAPNDDLESAALFIASSAQFYAGATHTSTWAMDHGNRNKNKAKVWADWFNRILPAAARLKDVQILNMDAITFIEKFSDREDYLFYIDPPYWGHGNEYGYKVDYYKLLEVMKTVKGKIIVSEYPDAAKYFKGWRFETLRTMGRAQTGRGSKGKINTEMLFFNF